MEKGPADAVVQEKMAQKFRLINDRYYTCTAEVFRGLGTLYVNDERFKANYEAVKPGLAEFMKDAMKVYADKMEGKR
jgi:hypothetical protein